MSSENKISKENIGLSPESNKSEKYKNIEEKVEASDVVVPVAELRGKLNEKIWGDDKLNPEVRQALLDIAVSFFDSLDLDIKIKDIYFTGSLANYGWTDKSDIDLHVIIDYGNYSDIAFLEDYLYLKKKNWIDNHNISIFGFEVEPFAKDEEAKHPYKAIYSVMKDKWVVEPRKDKPIIDFETVREKSASIMNAIDKVVDIKDKEKQLQAAEKLNEKLGGLREIGLRTSGEYSNENLIYKTLKRAGYLDKLSDTKYKAFDKKMSINESIKKINGDYAVYPSKGGNRLGTHDTKADALKQIAAIEISKEKRGVKENEIITNMGVTPIVHKLKVQKGIDGMDSEKVGIVKDFVNFVCVKLKMEQPVTVCLRRGRDEYIQTTASYVPSDNENHVRCGGRALVDILRSIAHELTHNRQRELNIFSNGDQVQNIGGYIEDQANSVAGVFIKDFTHNYGYDNIYDF